MAIAPFTPTPRRMGGEGRRTRLALVAATIGIAAALLAYAISPGVRHAVRHAAHSVNHTVSNIFDHDQAPRSGRRTPTRASAHRARPTRPVSVRQAARR